MQLRRTLAFVLVLALAAWAWGHDIGGPPVVIDTDMGLDDAVTLAMALQNADLHVAAIVASDGASGGERAAETAGRMLYEFNRSGVLLYLPAKSNASGDPPMFRGFVERALAATLPDASAVPAREFSPDAFAPGESRTTVLALGPLTNLAAALRADPALREHLERIIIPGDPNAEKNWNLARDPAAYAAVRSASVRLEFAAANDAATKPEAWADPKHEFGDRTSCGEMFSRRLLSEPAVREHYVLQRRQFCDELALVLLLDPTLFKAGDNNTMQPRSADALTKAITRWLTIGRQGKGHVVFVDGALPDEVLRPDVRERKARIIQKNGEDEWFAQLLMNELHEHLGLYSVIGVKMGLRAAELLNAPQHAMHITSHSAPTQPVSCINDGLLVGTGCTPGRGLFEHKPGPPDSVDVTFAYNGREITLRVKEEYRRKIKGHIVGLLQKHTLEDAAYWEGVRQFGLEAWENWHRRDLFEMVPMP